MYQFILNIPLWTERRKVRYTQVPGSPVSKLFYYKVSSDSLRQDSQSSYSLNKIQNVGETELSIEKI